jgi:leucine dehydrogenase
VSDTSVPVRDLSPKGSDPSPGGGMRAESVPPIPLDHEELVVRRGRRSGLWMAVAVHSTALGPALGGVRLWRYASPEDGVRDALRLARGMTFKAAAAGLDLGGGKGVICAPADAAWRNGGPGIDRRAVMHDFGDLVESLEGRYVTAEDVGVCAEDIATIAERTEHAVGLPEELGGAGDPSPFTALGVTAAMRACARHALGTDELQGLRVVIVGVGHCGEQLARRLAAEGAELALSDVDPAKHRLADELGAEWVEPGEAMLAPCDVLAPCALGGSIERSNVGRLRCAVVCGSANNVLADESLDRELAGRGIFYAPDFVANAGGLISVYRELHGLDAAEVARLVEGIEEAIDRVLDASRERSITPLRAAHQLAHERLESARAPIAA